MRFDRRLLGWGLFFILLGAVPLVVRAGLVDPEIVRRWPLLWPVLIIGGGVGLLLRGSPVEWIGGALTAVTFGLMGGGAIATGFAGVPAFGGCGGNGGAPAFETKQGTFAATGRISLEFNCGTLNVTTADGNGWTIAGSAAGGRGPEVTTGADGLVEARTPNRGPFDPSGGRQVWDVTLPRTTPVQAGITLNAGDSTIRLDGAHLDSFNLTVNAGSVRADVTAAAALPRAGLNGTVNAGSATLLLPAFDGSMNLSLNAGSLELCIPTGALIRVSWSGALASNDLDESGLVKVDASTWTSAGFDANAPHIELRVSANAGSFELGSGTACGT